VKVETHATGADGRHGFRPSISGYEEIAMLTNTEASKAALNKDRLSFGTAFTPHMLLADYDEERGWYGWRIEPYGPIELNPAAAVFHYGRQSSMVLKHFKERTAGSVYFGR
jgi:hypothetical protein